MVTVLHARSKHYTGLYIGWDFLVVGNSGTKEATKIFSVPEKQLINTCSLLLLATYSLVGVSDLTALPNQ